MARSCLPSRLKSAAANVAGKANKPRPGHPVFPGWKVPTPGPQVHHPPPAPPGQGKIRSSAAVKARRHDRVAREGIAFCKENNFKPAVAAAKKQGDSPRL